MRWALLLLAAVGLGAWAGARLAALGTGTTDLGRPGDLFPRALGGPT